MATLTQTEVLRYSCVLNQNSLVNSAHPMPEPSKSLYTGTLSTSLHYAMLVSSNSAGWKDNVGNEEVLVQWTPRKLQ